MSFITDTFLSLLIDNEIPYNLIIGDKGTSIYIIPRKFLESKKPDFNSSWLDLAGFPVVTNEELIKKIEKEGDECLSKLINENISLDDGIFKELCKIIIHKFSNKYKLK